MKLVLPIVLTLIQAIASQASPYSAVIEDGKCIKPAVRREIRDLSKTELTTYLDAVKQLHTKQPGGKMSKYEKLVNLHVAYYDEAHGVPPFLAWHRYFIKIYEVELQKIDPSIVLPYWDWSYDSRHPDRSPVLTNHYMGGQGNPDKEYCLTSGPFAGWKTVVDEPHCLTRRFDEDDKCSSFPSPEELIFLLNEPDFSEFVYQLELFHGSPHNALGYDPGDFAVNVSPNDPIFYLHHAFVDMLYSKWLAKHPESKYNGVMNRRRVHEENIMLPFRRSVKSTLDSQSDYFCYTYAEYPRKLTPPEDIIPASEFKVITKKGQSRTLNLPLNSYTNPAIGKLKDLSPEQALQALLKMKAQEKGRSRSFTKFGGEDGELGAIIPKKLPEKWLKLNHIDRNKAEIYQNRTALIAEALNALPIFVPLAL